MFCPNCGNQLEDGSRFCPACGNPVTSEGTQQGAQNTSGSTQNQYTQHIHMQYVYKDYLAHLVLPWTQPRVTFKPPLDWNERNLAPILGSNQQYYLDQFEWCAAKNSSNPNLPALFLTICHGFYRNMWKETLRYLLIPIVAYAVLALLSLVSLLSGSFGISALMIPVNIVLGVWFWISCLQYGKDFNLLYMEHVCKKATANDMTPDPSSSRVAIGCLVIFGILVVYGIIYSAVMSSMISSLLYW